ncbi:MAG: hypothetical protein O7E54_00385 [Planctomycetota bacterium]|nr:hypothetical protein [Planctomycetota bacterium]
MKLIPACVCVAAFALAIFLPESTGPRRPDLHVTDGRAAPRPCPADFAHVVLPDRSRVHLLAFFDDLSYAAADGGPVGCAVLLALFTLLGLIVSLWTAGIRTSLRRLFLGLALIAPFCLGMVHNSCFLPGRAIVLSAKAATDWVPASLHTQTHYTTGLLSPADLVNWHFSRGIRVLNVSDRDTIEGGVRALAAVRKRRLSAGRLLVLVGEEYHGRPDIVLINVRRDWKPDNDRADERRLEVIQGVHDEGGALFVAHPWSKQGPPLDELLGGGTDGIDGVEVVNGVILGGMPVIEAARYHNRAVVGSLDYKFGPHVNALTLLPARFATNESIFPLTPESVVKAFRAGHTRILYAIPGGDMTGAAWDSQPHWFVGAIDALQSLYAAPRPRRFIWFGWIVFGTVAWWLGTRGGEPPDKPGLWRAIFIVCVAVMLMSFGTLSWQIREIVVIPVNFVLLFCAVVAVPLIASSHNLALAEQHE